MQNIAKKMCMALMLMTGLLFQSVNMAQAATDPAVIVEQATAFYENEDYAKAFPLYKQAAEQGDPIAQFYLAECYELGHGVAANPEEAVNWARKSAEQGDADAQNMLGWYYDQGVGVPQDYAEAFKWFLKSAEQGNVESQYNVGVCYLNGDGVEVDEIEALVWLAKAAAQGDEEAQAMLVELGQSW